MTLTLETSVQYVPRVGPRMATLLEKLGILTVGDLLRYPPFRYNDYATVIPINRVKPKQTVSIKGTVTSIKNVFTKNGKKMQQAVVEDGTGKITVIWFNQIYLPKVIHTGDLLSLSGTIDFFGSLLAMVSPDYELCNPDAELLSTGRIVPVYPETAGITSKWLRGRIAFLLATILPELSDLLPLSIRNTYHLLPFTTALKHLHFPDTFPQSVIARQRLAFDELFFLQLQSYITKRLWQEQTHAPNFSLSEKAMEQFIASLPFTLTEDQKKAVAEIRIDLSRPIPMNRLLEGDVGSGKTVIAAFGAYAAWKNGFQSIIMAPTQILAQQHYQTIQKLLSPFAIPVELILGGQKQKKTLPPARSSLPSVLIGTHALLEETVAIKNLGFVVIDEQQRFGVKQRNIIREKGNKAVIPHFLTMTATPIPRTIALTMYGNLDLSVLSQMPKGRIPIKTWVVPQEKRQAAYAWIRKELGSDAQAFIVCPFIEESESMTTVKAAKKEFEHLRKEIFPDLPMGLLHGKMKGNEKTDILTKFREGTIKILVTTPVVEVGIDIPQASIMLIEASDRFGLSQLHQLRGRVGRGNAQSYCLLFTENTNPQTQERLKIMEKVSTGPKLAEYDLTMRGEGDVFGIRQHGIPALALASLSDRMLVETVQKAVQEITTADPDLSGFPLLRENGKKGTIGISIQD